MCLPSGEFASHCAHEHVLVAAVPSSAGHETLQAEAGPLEEIEDGLWFRDFERQTTYPVDNIAPRIHTTTVSVGPPGGKWSTGQEIADRCGAPQA